MDIKTYGKKILCVLTASAILAAFGLAAAASREDIAAINITQKAKFAYWAKDSAAKRELVNFVRDVTDPESENFIPPAERIAVFDCDGTIMCETGPYYFDWMLPLHRVLNDKTYTAPDTLLEQAAKINNAIRNKTVTASLDAEVRDWFPKVFDGMTVKEYRDYTEKYMTSTSLERFTNLKAGEAFYLPMAEVISYLDNNDFQVYIVSASEREALRALIGDIMPIPPEHIIGSDHIYRALHQGTKEGSKHFFTDDDKIIRGNKKIDLNTAANKVYKIQREIGRQPVLAFGNSMEDAGMLQYTLMNNPHKSASFVVICDDNEREFGNPTQAAKMTKAAHGNGWITISMAKDFADIYGGKVRAIKKHYE